MTILKKFTNTHAFFFFLILGFILYANTLNHDYTLDDALVITENAFTKKGIAGISDHLTNDLLTGFYGQEKQLVAGGRYRPLSLILFSLEYEFFGLNPFVGHLMNLLFYVLNGFLLYIVLKLLLKEKTDTFKLVSLSLLTSLLWFFHPIHTEVVANIKGRDEILSFCLALSSLYFSLKFIDKNQLKHIVFLFICFFFALLAKENSITWLAVIPISIYFFREFKLKKVFFVFGTLILASLFWFAIRTNVVGELSSLESVADNLMNDPFLHSNPSEKYATIVLTLGKYIQLLIFPHPLTFDYYPKHIPIVNWLNPLVLISLLVYTYLIYLAIKGFFRKSIISYSILFFGITLSIASNLFFPIGAFMNERFVYASSMGFCLAFACFSIYLSNKYAGKDKTMILRTLMLVILALYTIKTISRNRVWKNNLRLATHDANISVNGAKSNVMAGGLLLEKAAGLTASTQKQQLIEEAIFYLDRAVNIYPAYIDALLLMGNAKWEQNKMASQAMGYYSRILAINIYNANAWRNIHIVLSQNENKDYSIAAYEKLIQMNPNQVESYINLGRLYGQYKNQLDKAIEVLEKAEHLAPQNIEILSNLGIAYGLKKDYSNAIRVLEKAEKIQPNNAKIKSDLGLSYYFMARLEEAKLKFDEAVKLNPSLDRSQFPI